MSARWRPQSDRCARCEEWITQMIGDTRPGLNAQRLVRLMRAAVARCQLDLAGRVILTEAATGAYAVTPVLAALAGAEVYALAATTGFGSAVELRKTTEELAALAGVTESIRFVTEKSPAVVGAADIVTNSGQVRPIDASFVARMKPSSVVPLMYESWEYRRSDVDLEACRARSIVVAGTNERHPAVDVFSFLGTMAIKQLHDAGIAVRGSRLVVLCDNSFAPFIVKGLRDAGADVTQTHQLTEATLNGQCDAVLLALQPDTGRSVDAAQVTLLSDRAPGAVLVQYWGDADRLALAAAGVPVWPEVAPKAGHMGILPSAVGPEPVIRLQAGGLKVGQLLTDGLDQASAEERALVQLL
jgi:hypothetical protein